MRKVKYRGRKSREPVEEMAEVGIENLAHHVYTHEHVRRRGNKMLDEILGGKE